MPGPVTSKLRPALELAWAVGRAGMDRQPPVPPPGPLRPLLRFARLPDRALGTVRAVLEEDEAFRAAVAALGDETLIGRIPWLWLARPDGWEDEIAEIEAGSAEAALAAEDERAERVARRRLQAVEAVLARAEEELTRTRERAQAAVAEAAQARAERRAVEERAAELAGHLAGADRRRVEADEHAARAVAALNQTRAELHAARARQATAEGQVQTLMERLAASEAELAGWRQRGADAERRAGAVQGALGSAIASAGEAAAMLGAALADAARVLDGAGPDRPEGTDGRGPTGRDPDGAGPDGPGPDGWSGPVPPGGRPDGGARRRPLRLPGAVFDDSVEAAHHLLRARGVVLIVDGYNVTLATWPDLSLVDQRHRLVHALGEMAMRTGAAVEVVFDGADEGHHHPAPGSPRRPVRVVFSPAGIDADEVIIERTRQLPVLRPVVVATDDRRVRDAVRSLGANVVGAGQLVDALGRSGARR